MAEWSLAQIPSQKGKLMVVTGANSGIGWHAATAPDAAPESYYAPDRMFQLKGDPVLVPIPKPARDAAAARRLWEISEADRSELFDSVIPEVLR